MMFVMMRGMHGGEGHSGHDEHHSAPQPPEHGTSHDHTSEYDEAGRR